MDVPTPIPRPDPVPPGADAPGSPVPPPALSSPRSAQVALGVFLAVTLGLLAFRGSGSIFGARPTDTAAPARVDLNRADRAELAQVPGIGSSLANEIEDDRRKKGPFKSVEELRRVKGVGPATFDKVRAYLRVEPAAVSTADTSLPEPLILERKPTPAPYPRTGGAAKKLQPGDPPINVNVAGVDELMRLPGVGTVTAQNIVASRAERPFRSLADLDRVRNIGTKTLDKIRPFVVFE